MVDDATQHGVVNDDELNSSLALSMARHAAIPQGQVLDNQEMENLVNELFVCSNVNYTPDGKPILAILPQHDIEQLLG
jgi:DNA mismatch repair protein MutL